MNLARRCWICSEWPGVITNDTVSPVLAGYKCCRRCR